MTTRQRGGTIVGFIFGLIVGLGVALAVVVYVMKVPVPFITKGGLRGPEQDAAEAEKNRNWNPNQALAGKPAPARPAEPAAPAASEAVAPTPSKVAEPKPDAKDAAKDAVAKNAKDKDASKPAASADPLGDFARPRPRRPRRSHSNTLCRPARSTPSQMPMRSAPSWPCWDGKRA